MNNQFLCSQKTAQKLYAAVRELPIYDYHCHLSPQAIFEDTPFDNIGELWLGGDHYKWRLMRAAGVKEEYITGDANWHDKFLQYAKTMELAPGNPLVQWNRLELAIYFGIEVPVCLANVEQIWQQANRVIHEKQLSPRKLIALSHVQYIATTDDICDDLNWHRRLREDTNFTTKVVPSYRTDAALMIARPDYKQYLARLENICGFKIDCLSAFQKALIARLDFFVANGCRFTDIGIPVFPTHIAQDEEAQATFARALSGAPISDDALCGFLGNLFVFLGKAYRQRDLVMQWHLAAYRNASGALFSTLGANIGGDCIGDSVPGGDIIRILNAIDCDTGLPQTILYSLNPSATEQLATIAGSFCHGQSQVRCGASWWFCDHKDGILRQLRCIAQVGLLGAFPGMLTDSRSFLSYARHDYFRRILSSLLAEWVDADELDYETALTTAKALCLDNTKRLAGETI